MTLQKLYIPNPITNMKIQICIFILMPHFHLPAICLIHKGEGIKTVVVWIIKRMQVHLKCW
jgi:hypothetical protein